MDGVKSEFISSWSRLTLGDVTSCVPGSNFASRRDGEALLRVKPQLTHTRKRTSHRNQDASERFNNLSEALVTFDHFMNAADLWLPKDEDGRFLSAFEYLP